MYLMCRSLIDMNVFKFKHKTEIPHALYSMAFQYCINIMIVRYILIYHHPPLYVVVCYCLSLYFIVGHMYVIDRYTLSVFNTYKYIFNFLSILIIVLYIMLCISLEVTVGHYEHCCLM